MQVFNTSRRSLTRSQKELKMIDRIIDSKAFNYVLYRKYVTIFGLDIYGKVPMTEWVRHIGDNKVLQDKSDRVKVTDEALMITYDNLYKQFEFRFCANVDFKYNTFYSNYHKRFTFDWLVANANKFGLTDASGLPLEDSLLFNADLYSLES